jgi:hypothetical protein
VKRKKKKESGAGTHKYRHGIARAGLTWDGVGGGTPREKGKE